MREYLKPSTVFRPRGLPSALSKEYCDYSRSIPSVPSSPAGDREIDQIGNVDSHNHLIPDAPRDHGFYPSIPSVCQADYEKDVYHAPFNNDSFTMPRLPVGRKSESTKSIGTCNEKDLRQENQILKTNSVILQNVSSDARKHFSSFVSDIAIMQMLGDGVITNTNEEEILTANDMITPVINFENINENLLSSTKKHVDKICDPSMPAKTFLEILNQETNERKHPTRDNTITDRQEGVTKIVDWEDMFDTELFPDIIDPLQLKPPLEDSTGRNFQIKFHKQIHKDRKTKQNRIGNKVTKPKTQIKNNIASSKNIKKVTCASNKSEHMPKINSRKVKYTKVVSNWLDDVNPTKFVEDEVDRPMNGPNHMIKTKMPIMQDKNVEKIYFEDKSKEITKDKTVETYINPKEAKAREDPESQIYSVNDQGPLNNNGAEGINQSKTMTRNETVIVKDSTTILIDKKPKAKSKKTVQTRLAEKDGKMKFGPPVKDHESTTDLPEDKETKNKEKKVKAKFVPPIKSQLPVKNVTFDVNTIDESNVHLIQDMINSDDNDNNITVVVVYSNGFCQLNNNHTEENCVPEGIIIQKREKFFYHKHNERNRDLIRRILEKSHIVCYSGKRLLVYLITKYDLELKQDVLNLSDAKIGASLIDPDNPPENFAELQKLLEFTPEFTIATECVLQKAAWYTSLLTECFNRLKSILIQNSVWDVFVEIEMPLLLVIAGMEYQGVCVDLEKLKAMEDILLTKMKAVEQECYKAAGKTFQINSTLQVRTILYDELQLDTKSNLKIKETIGKGAKSTSETMLRGLVSVHPLPRLILEYRHLHKAYATFLTGIAQHVKDGTVKPSWAQTAAATGRIASNNPNLQAIPKAPFSLVVFPEKSDEQEMTLNFRSVYTARPEHSFLAADFKHIECRVFAHAADDATLQDALRSGQDLFRVLAAKWLSKSVEEISSEDRERTKRIVYASLYGAGARKLMEILHVGYEQALSVMSSFNRTFPALKSFGRAVAARATRGALRSLSGRARRLPHIASADAALRAQAERQAVNFVVQGSAADLCKKAMVCVQRRLSPAALRCRLVLQIHDELVWEVADEDVEAAAAIIKDAMENVGRECGMGMTLPVELTRGRNWGEMEPFSSPDY